MLVSYLIAQMGYAARHLLKDISQIMIGLTSYSAWLFAASTTLVSQAPLHLDHRRIDQGHIWQYRN